MLVLRATPLNQKGKRGLVTVRTASCSSARKPGLTNLIRDFKSIAWQRLICSAHAYSWPCNFCGYLWRFFCNYCILRERLAVRMVTRPLFLSDWVVWRARLVLCYTLLLVIRCTWDMCSRELKLWKGNRQYTLCQRSTCCRSRKCIWGHIPQTANLPYHANYGQNGSKMQS